MSNAMFKVWVKMRVAKMKAEDKIRACAADFVNEQKGGPSDLVIPIVIIVILIALAIIFRDQLSAMINNLFGKANDQVDKLDATS